MKKTRKRERRLQVGDAVLVWRKQAEVGERTAPKLQRGVVAFIPPHERFVTVDVTLPPAAFRHEAIVVRETYWPELVSREAKR